FTSYSNDRLRKQLSGWVDRDGCRFVKMKVGSRPEEDVQRVSLARQAAGKASLFVDANGAYSRKQALWFAERFAEFNVTWLEEPVSSDDLDRLRLLRDRAPGGMDIAVGEYGYESFYFRRLLAAGAVDVLQADATRCCGYTGVLRAVGLADAGGSCASVGVRRAGAGADAGGVPLSSHCAPALHLPVCCAAPRIVHME